MIVEVVDLSRLYRLDDKGLLHVEILFLRGLLRLLMPVLHISLNFHGDLLYI
jgi:hypothetical protein